MAKTYDSPEANDSQVTSTGVSDSAGVEEAGRKGGSTAAVYPRDESSAGTDYTSTTSEKSSARFVVPLIIAFIVIVSFLALRSRFTPGSVGGHDAAINATGSTGAGQNGAAAR